MSSSVISLGTSAQADGGGALHFEYGLNTPGDGLLEQAKDNLEIESPDVFLFIKDPVHDFLIFISSADTLESVRASPEMTLCVLNQSDSPKFLISPIIARFIRSPRDFIEGESIGHGGFGSVKKATDVNTGREFAKKDITRFAHEDRRQHLREMNVQATVRHPTVLELRAVVVNGDTVSILTDLMEYGSVVQCRENKLELSILEKFKIIYGVAAGMLYLHSARILHRDLKPDNVLLDSGKLPKICDFGFSKNCDPGNSGSTTNSMAGAGTPGYMAPEVILEEKVTWPADVFAYAMVVYYVWFGEPPYSGAIFRMNREIVDGARPKMPHDTPAELRRLLENCWEHSATARLTFEEVTQRLGNRETVLAMGLPEEDYVTYSEYVASLATKLLRFDCAGRTISIPLALTSKIGEAVPQLRESFGTPWFVLVSNRVVVPFHAGVNELDDHVIEVRKYKSTDQASIKACIEARYRIDQQFVRFKVKGEIIGDDEPVRDDAEPYFVLPVKQPSGAMMNVEIDPDVLIGVLIERVCTACELDARDIVLVSKNRKLEPTDPLFGLICPLTICQTFPVEFVTKGREERSIVVRFIDTDTFGVARDCLSKMFGIAVRSIFLMVNGENQGDEVLLSTVRNGTVTCLLRNPDLFQVILKHSSGKTQEWFVHVLQKIKDMRREMAENFRLDMGGLTLSCNGKQLDDDEDVRPYEGMVIDVHVSHDIETRKYVVDGKVTSVRAHANVQLGYMRDFFARDLGMDRRDIRLRYRGEILSDKEIMSRIPRDEPIQLDLSLIRFTVPIGHHVYHLKYAKNKTVYDMRKEFVDATPGVSMKQFHFRDSHTGDLYLSSTLVTALPNRLVGEISDQPTYVIMLDGRVCRKQFDEEATVLDAKTELRAEYLMQNGEILPDTVRLVDTSDVFDLVAVSEASRSPVMNIKVSADIAVQVAIPMGNVFLVGDAKRILSKEYLHVRPDEFLVIDVDGDDDRALPDRSVVEATHRYRIRVITETKRRYMFAYEGTRVSMVMSYLSSVAEVTRLLCRKRQLVSARLRCHGQCLDPTKPMCFYEIRESDVVRVTDMLRIASMIGGADIRRMLMNLPNGNTREIMVEHDSRVEDLIDLAGLSRELGYQVELYDGDLHLSPTSRLYDVKSGCLTVKRMGRKAKGTLLIETAPDGQAVARTASGSISAGINTVKDLQKMIELKPADTSKTRTFVLPEGHRIGLVFASDTTLGSAKMDVAREVGTDHIEFYDDGREVDLTTTFADLSGSKPIEVRFVDDPMASLMPQMSSTVMGGLNQFDKPELDPVTDDTPGSLEDPDELAGDPVWRFILPTDERREYRFTGDTTLISAMETISPDLEGIDPTSVELYVNGNAANPFDDADFRMDELVLEEDRATTEIRIQIRQT